MNYRYYFADYENPQAISNMLEYSFVPNGKYPQGSLQAMIQKLFVEHPELGDFKSAILLTRNGCEHIGKIKREKDSTVETVGAFICKNSINIGECVAGIYMDEEKTSATDRHEMHYKAGELLKLFGYHKIAFVTE